MTYENYLDPDYDPLHRHKAFRCDNCDGQLYEGDDYYLIDHLFLCPGCAEAHFKGCRKTAERTAV